MLEWNSAVIQKERRWMERGKRWRRPEVIAPMRPMKHEMRSRSRFMDRKTPGDASRMILDRRHK
jgi:hypothetical protein